MADETCAHVLGPRGVGKAGELTSTQKVKGQMVAEKYRALLESLYV
jgi:hypothetical protein